MPKILIVEDESLVARMFQKMFTHDGFEVELAAGGDDGIRKAKEWQPDVVLMDIMMPGLNGLDALEQMKIIYIPWYLYPLQYMNHYLKGLQWAG